MNALHLEEITTEVLWKSFVLMHSPQSLFQSWQWGEIEKKSGTPLYRFGIYEHKNLLGVAQIFVVRAKRGTYLHIRQGPVLVEYSQELLDKSIQLFTDIAKKERALFIRMSPMVEDSELHKNLFARSGLKPSPIHEVDAERCWVLDISQTEDALLQGMRKTTRYEIRRGLKMDIEIKQTANVKDLSEFISLYKETSKRHGFVSHGSIVEEFEYFAARDEALLLLGYVDHVLIASAIIVFYGGQAIYHHGASLPSKVPVSYMLQWRAIQEAKKRNIPLYNFYGIAPEGKKNHPWNGLTLFKKGFGGREVRYMHAYDFPLSPLYIVPHLIESVRTKIRGYV